MLLSIKPKCPECGHEQISIEGEMNGLDSVVGATCVGCGYTYTEVDKEAIIDQAREQAKAELLKALKR